MYIEIINKDNLLDEFFARWLVRKIKNNLILQLKKSQLKKWDAYFENNEPFPKLSPETIISTYSILMFGINNINYQFLPSKICIRVNSNLFTPNFNRVKIEQICRFIEFGNQDISGLNLFVPVFEEVAANINDYVHTYLGGF